MKHKKQLRWLLFLLIPFNILFTIHILTPLEFISNNGSMLQYYAGDEQMSLYRYTTISYTTFSRRALNNMFRKYAHTLNTLNNLFWCKPTDSSYLDLKPKNTTKINAYQLNQQLNKSSGTSSSYFNQSMWFSPGYKSQKQLPSKIKQVFDEYFKIDSMISNLLFIQGDRLVHSVTSYASIDDQSIFFQYPAAQNDKFMNLSAEVLDNYYTSTLGYYEANNQGLSIVPFIEYSTTQKISLLVFCTPRWQNNEKRVMCIKLRANELEYQVRSNFNPLNFSQLNFTYYLMMNPDFTPSGSKPAYIIFQQNQFYSKDQFDEASSKFINNNVKTQNGTRNKTIQSYQVMYYYQLGFKVFFFSPINIDPFNKVAAHYFIVCIIQLQESVMLNQNMATNFPQILIPVTLLVVIASILTSYIVKLILNNMQKQLYILDQPCQFIVDGNLDVELPEYQGSKDIKNLYDLVRVINKLHRYSVQSYFSGHFSQKLLKYAQALQLFKHLGYDTGNILQNMGEAYTYIEQWHKGREVLKQSIHLVLQQIQSTFGNLNDIIMLKKQRKITFLYKQLELILVRRLFKLNYNYLIYLDQRPSFIIDRQSKSRLSIEQNTQIKDLLLHKECLKYLRMLKKIFYPQFIGYAQCIIMLYYQAKEIAYLQNTNVARSSFLKIDRLLNLYSISYFQNRKTHNQLCTRQNLQISNKKAHELKQKPLTHYYKLHPDILKAFRNFFQYRIIQNQSKDLTRYLPAIDALCETLGTKTIPARINYLALYYVRSMLIELGIDTRPFQSTQIFRQMMPFSSFEFQIDSDIENKTYHFPTQYSSGLQREYILIFDCGKNYVENDQRLTKYLNQRVQYLHEKLIKSNDRISIIKFNSRLGVQIQCKLLMKENSQVLLKKSLTETVRERSSTGTMCLGLVQAIARGIQRVKHLRSQKIVILFFRSVQQYKEKMYRIHRKHADKRNKNRKSSDSSIKAEQPSEMEIEEMFPQKFGEWVVYLLQDDQLKNLKLIFFCAKEDSRQDLQNFFSLREINRRIWSKNGGLNVNNNLVYIIEEKYKTDIDRILMLKAKIMPDNHIFIF